MKLKLLFIFICLSLLLPFGAWAFDKGIYIDSTTAEHPKRIEYFIKQAKAVGINTFVVDVYNRSKPYTQSMNMLRENGINYVARVVVFPWGGSSSDVQSKEILAKRWKWAQYAIELGASAIQLDYVRYKPSQPYSYQNAHDIHNVIKFFKGKLAGTNVKLQVDVFGIAAKAPSIRIGQDMKLFAQTVDAICPMVYPSHYEPFRYHATRPYQTIHDTLTGLKKQITAYPNVKIFPFIELYNYRYPLSYAEKVKYIKDEIKAAQDHNTAGYYVWNAKNDYEILFNILRSETKK